MSNNIYAYCKREFLNDAELVHTSYILAHVEDSENGTTSHGSNALVIADCRRSILLEFYLGSEEHRSQSLNKIDLLLRTISEFRDELLNQAGLISAGKHAEEEQEG